MFNYILKIELNDGTIDERSFSSVGPVSIGEIIEIRLLMGEAFYRVVSVCHCDKGVILTLEAIYK